MAKKVNDNDRKTLMQFVNYSIGEVFFYFGCPPCVSSYVKLVIPPDLSIVVIWPQGGLFHFCLLSLLPGVRLAEVSVCYL